MWTAQELINCVVNLVQTAFEIGMLSLATLKDHSSIFGEGLRVAKFLLREAIGSTGRKMILSMGNMQIGYRHKQKSNNARPSRAQMSKCYIRMVWRNLE